MIRVYLLFLLIAPQLWWPPMLNWRTDFVIFPLWALAVVTGKNKPYFFGSQEKMALLFFFWLLVSSLINGLSNHSTGALELYLPRFLVYFLTVLSLRSLGDVKKVIQFFVFLSLLLAVEGIQHKFSVSGLGWAGQERGWIDPSVIAAGGTGRTKWVGIFDGPGVFAVIYLITLPFLLFYAIGPFKRSLRLASFLATLLMLVAIYVNGSRGGLLAAMAIFGIGLVYRIKLNLRVVIVFSVLSLLVLAMAPSHLTTVNDSSNSSAHRIDMWVEALEMLTQNPLFGIGLGEFKYYTGHLIAHNSHLNLVGETGLPGYFFWLGLSYLALRNMVWLVRDPGTTDQNKAFAWALGTSIVGYHVASFFVTLEYVTFYLLLGLASYSNFYPDKKIPPLTKRDYQIIAGCGIVILGTFKVLITLYQL